MNRTIIAVFALAIAWGAEGIAQDGAKPADGKAQPGPVDRLVATMQAAEKAFTSLQLEMRTSSTWPDGSVMTTRGTLRVLRGGQAAIHTKFEFRSDDGVRGRSESVQSADGIVLFEDDAAFGEVFALIDKKLVADLEWAGEVLRRDGLPGMRDRRAEAPLGSQMLASLQSQFDLVEDEKRKDRAGEPGAWLVGKRKKGLDESGGELPVADAVEAFVRSRDHALLEVRQLEADKVVQHLVVESVILDAKLDPASFQVQSGTGTPRAVQPPLSDTIEQTIKQAEAKKARELEARKEKDPAARDEKPEVRPSRR